MNNEEQSTVPDELAIAFIIVTDNLNRDNPAFTAVQNFINIYEQEVASIDIVGPNYIEFDNPCVNHIPVNRNYSENKFRRLLNYIRFQLGIAGVIYSNQNRYDVVFFHIGGSMLLVPILLCRLADLRSVVFITGSTERSYKEQHGQSIGTKVATLFIRTVESITCSLSTDTIILSKSMDVPQVGPLQPSDVTVANFNYINCDEFEKRKPLENRPHDVVFIGRFEPVKGIQNIITAIPMLVEKYPDLSVTLIGDGSLRDSLETDLEKEGLTNHVTFTGWVDHDTIPEHLNEACTIIIPSESEGVPKTIMEAMACGTVPIATPVGGIPDIINHSNNGFFLSKNKPKQIARTISAVLERDDLDQISDNARQVVEEKYSYDNIKRQYRDILCGDELVNDEEKWDSL